jgi:hypothetical protein
MIRLDDSAGWVTIGDAPDRPGLAFQRVADYSPPRWPDPNGRPLSFAWRAHPCQLGHQPAVVQHHGQLVGRVGAEHDVPLRPVEPLFAAAAVRDHHQDAARLQHPGQPGERVAEPSTRQVVQRI